MRAEKKCRSCGEVKPLEAFSRRLSASDGREASCKNCRNTRNRETVKRLHGNSRHYHLRQRFGIGADEVEAMIQAQGGLCAICGEEPATQVDHDHRSETKGVGGILCDGCNGGLGAFGDDPQLIQRAIDYIKKWRS